MENRKMRFDGQTTRRIKDRERKKKNVGQDTEVET